MGLKTLNWDALVARAPAGHQRSGGSQTTGGSRVWFACPKCHEKAFVGRTVGGAFLRRCTRCPWSEPLTVRKSA